MRDSSRLEPERVVLGRGFLHSGGQFPLVVEGPMIDLLEIVLAESAQSAISADVRAAVHDSA